ncbi:MAG: hypothetical protein KF805_11950 [Phycisphaeraceae bacterium]|nr:hypothetical protein [Phycisphaeraceae bacterium]
MTRFALMLCIGPLACSARGVLAPEPVPPVPASQPPKTDGKPAEKPPGAVPDLDSLLGTKPDTAAAKPDASDPSKKELDRQLSLKEQADEFAKAVELMNETADRVENESDTGLATQRLQEDILTRLDRLIKAAEQNSSSKSKQKQKADEDQQKNKNMRQQSQAQSKQAANTPGEKADGPSREDGALGNVPIAPPASWGDLPAHVRDALMQGFSDKFSSMYQGMTESYYRRLAEEKKK